MRLKIRSIKKHYYKIMCEQETWRDYLLKSSLLNIGHFISGVFFIIFQHNMTFKVVNIIMEVLVIKINKTYLIILFAVLISVVFSNLIISSYRDEMVLKSDGNIYLLQYGIYTTKDVMIENVKKLNDYIIYEDDGKYYVYLGVYINYENAYKYSKLLENNKIYTYIKNDYLSNNDVVKKLNILDNKMVDLKKESEMRSLNREMLDLYREYLN